MASRQNLGSSLTKHFHALAIHNLCLSIHTSLPIFLSHNRFLMRSAHPLFTILLCLFVWPYYLSSSSLSFTIHLRYLNCTPVPFAHHIAHHSILIPRPHATFLLYSLLSLSRQTVKPLFSDLLHSQPLVLDHPQALNIASSYHQLRLI